MINRVKLIFQHQLDEMRKLHRDDTVSTQKDFHAFDKVVDVRNMGQNVVAQQKIGLDSFSNQLFGRLLTSLPAKHISYDSIDALLSVIVRTCCLPGYFLSLGFAFGLEPVLDFFQPASSVNRQ